MAKLRRCVHCNIPLARLNTSTRQLCFKCQYHPDADLTSKSLKALFEASDIPPEAMPTKAINAIADKAQKHRNEIDEA